MLILAGLSLVMLCGPVTPTSATPAASASASATPSAFTISGSGWGHGVGMSQWGARGRAANRGETYDQILHHYYTGTTVNTVSEVNDLRVLIADSQSSVTIKPTALTTFTPGGTVGPGSTVTLTRSGSSITLAGGLIGTVSAPVSINLGATGGSVAVNAGDSYRYGTLSISTGSATGLRVVVGGLTMRQYLWGLGEMPSSWPTEALKAQAAAARTYAQKQTGMRRGKPAYADYDLNSSLDGAYRGTRFEAESTNYRWRDAVDATSGVVVLHGSSLIDAVYSASSGGRSTESETAWVSSVPYLQSVDDSDDLTGGNPHASWTGSFTSSEIGAWFGVGVATAVSVTGAVPASQHLDKTSITITGSAGSTTVTGTQFKNTLNSNAGGARLIKSTKFTISGSVSPTPPPPAPPTSPPTTPAYGQLLVATAEKRQVIIAGDSVDPDGAPLVRVTSTMGSQSAVYEQRSTNGKFLFVWTGAPGTRNVCVTLFDTPTGAATSLGCRSIVVK